jgi:hypothetical protein
MATKLYDLAVKTGSYTNAQNEQKNRYENIGSVMQGDDGGQFVIMKRTFNPAGVPNPDCKDSVLISCFEPQQNNQGQQGGQQQQGSQGQQQQGGYQQNNQQQGQQQGGYGSNRG